MKSALPPHIGHGTATAHGHYRCRCEDCRRWRREYDRPRRRNQVEWQRNRREACRQYVWSKGLRFYGSGPFYRNPVRLAVLLAEYLNDDLTAYVNEYIRQKERTS